MSNIWAVYNEKGERLLQTENIMKARGFATVRNLKVESDKGFNKNEEKKTLPIKSKVEQTKEQIEKDQEILNKLGIVQTKALYDEGTQLIGLGKENLEKSRTEYNEMPNFMDGITAIIDTIKTEEREKIYVPIKDIRMNSKQEIALGGTEYFKVEDTVQFFGRLGIFPSFNPMYLKTIRNQEDKSSYVAEFFNKHINAYSQRDEGNEIIQFGVRNGYNSESRSIFRSVSRGYTAIEADTVLEQFSNVENIRVGKFEGFYDGGTTNFSVTSLFHANHETIGAGSVFKFGLNMKGNDRGKRAHSLNAVAWRNLCLNLLIIAQEKSKLARVLHKGDFNKQIAKLNKALLDSEPIFNEFIAHWGYLESKNINEIKLNKQTFESVEDALEWLVLSGKINIQQKEDILLENLLSGYAYESGDKLSDLVNAITRTAHTKYKGSKQKMLEEQAGILTRELVYA